MRIVELCLYTDSLYNEGGLYDQPIWFIDHLEMRKEMEAEYNRREEKRLENQAKKARK